MFKYLVNLVPAACFAFALNASLATADAVNPTAMPGTGDDGIIKVKSAYALPETVTRLEKDVADKGIKFFIAVDQSKLAADAGIQIRPSTLIVFGNPPLGTLFIAANPLAGLDWPVRLLVFQDDKGDVWAAYTDFAYIARRHGIKGMDNEAFQKASGVIASITSSVATR
jgi:uncharacterized protein (DUF302 family)